MALLDKLEYGRHNRFKIVGKVQTSDTSFKGPKNYENSTWYGVNESFGIDSGDGNVVYVTVSGGYDLKRNTIFARNTNFEMINIPVADRHNKEWTSIVAPSDFKRASIVQNGDHAERKEFISDIDYAEYLKNNLVNGMEVVVTGEISYNPAKDGERVYRQYQVKNIYLNEVVEEDGVEMLKNEKEAHVRQTYLIDEYSLASSYKKELKDNGQTIISVYVPQYLGKIFHNGQKVEWKRVTPLSQAIVLKVLPEDKGGLAKTVKWAEALFKLKRDTVREIHLDLGINEGYDTQTGDIEITPSMQALIDEGIFTLEEVKGQATVRGSRTSELVYKNPFIDRDEDGNIVAFRDDKYSPQALVMPIFDDSEGESEAEEEVASNETTLDDNDFESIFGI